MDSALNSWQYHTAMAMELSRTYAGAEQLQEGIDQTSAQLQQAADQAPEVAADLVQQVSAEPATAQTHFQDCICLAVRVCCQMFAAPDTAHLALVLAAIS